MKRADEFHFSVVEAVSDRQLFYFELVLDFIHTFEVVHLEVTMRPTDLTLEMGKLLAAAGRHNPKFDTV